MEKSLVYGAENRMQSVWTFVGETIALPLFMIPDGKNVVICFELLPDAPTCDNRGCFHKNAKISTFVKLQGPLL